MPIDLKLIRFEGKVAQKGADTVIIYGLRNGTRSEVAIFNRVPGPDGKFGEVPGYIDLDGDRLRIQFLVLTPPPELQHADRPLPFCSVVPPGGSLVQELLLRSPVAVNHPYQHGLAALRAPANTEVLAVDPHYARSVQIIAGLFEVAPPLKMIPLGGEYPDVFRPWPPGPAVEGQQLVQWSAPLPQPLTVLTYLAVPRRE